MALLGHCLFCFRNKTNIFCVDMQVGGKKENFNGGNMAAWPINPFRAKASEKSPLELGSPYCSDPDCRYCMELCESALVQPRIRWSLGSSVNCDSFLAVRLTGHYSFRSQLLRRRSTCILLGHKKTGCARKAGGKGMAGQTLEAWQQLCKLAAREQDPDRLIEMICMIQNRLLDEKEQQLKNIRNTNHYLPGPSEEC